jgi:hypothetical protein
MSIPVTCPNGHALKVRNDQAGKLGLCPHCKAPVRVPTPAATEVSEDAILGILNRPDSARPSPAASGISLAEPPHPEHGEHSVPKKICFKCNREIPVTVHICPFCHTYIARLGDF